MMRSGIFVDDVETKEENNMKTEHKRNDDGEDYVCPECKVAPDLIKYDEKYQYKCPVCSKMTDWFYTVGRAMDAWKKMAEDIEEATLESDEYLKLKRCPKCNGKPHRETWNLKSQGSLIAFSCSNDYTHIRVGAYPTLKDAQKAWNAQVDAWDEHVAFLVIQAKVRELTKYIANCIRPD